MIDAHCHLNFEDYQQFCNEHKSVKSYNVADILTRAQNSGVQNAIAVGTNLNDSAHNIELAKEWNVSRETLTLFAGVGIHPDNAEKALKTMSEQQIIDKIKDLSNDKFVVCLGECGLDYRIDDCDKTTQRRIFELSCHLSKQLELPLQIHSRYADKDTLDILRNDTPDGVMHCFTGEKELAKKYLDIGLSLSFSGIATFKNATLIRDTIKYTPLDRILTETDAPFLAPAPHRGEINEPAMVQFTTRCIAEIKNVDSSLLCKQILENFIHVLKRSEQLCERRS